MSSFCKNAFRGPGTQWSSRRRSRGARGRFGPLVDGLCPLQKAAYAGGDPGAAGASGAKSRARPLSQRQHISCPGRGALTAACRVGRSIHITRPPDPFAPRLGRRSRRSSRRWSRSGPRKFEKLYVDKADVLDRWPMRRRPRRRRGLPPILFLDAWGARQRCRGPRTYEGVMRSRRAVEASWSIID